jgi:alkaline phosphatase D
MSSRTNAPTSHKAPRPNRQTSNSSPVGHENGRIYRTISYGPLLDVFVLDMRTYRNPNGPDNQTTDQQGILGARQAEWLKRSLAASKATWKVVASDMPLSLVVPDADRIEAVSQGDNGKPLGRELQIADVSLHRRHPHAALNLAKKRRKRKSIALMRTTVAN